MLCSKMLIDPKQTTVLNPDFIVKAHRPSPLGGPEMEFDYRVAGFTVSGKTMVKEYQTPTRLVTITSGGFESLWDWQLKPQRKATHVSLVVDYTLPGGFMGVVMGKLGIDQYNDRALEDLLRNLKRHTERAMPAGV
ncbi:MAG: SRPBCC family protein [Anaerolineae bacterium]|nr:SRPBCC family protein [Anaerolineae bacterium]